MPTEDLISYVFDGRPQPLAHSVAAWLASSRRFAAFLEANKDKVRKKLRTTQDAERLLDLRLELESAYLLLQERALSVEYEPRLDGGTGNPRGPDFAVTYTTSFTFLVEVTRLRAGANAGDVSSDVPSADRLGDAIVGKLRQLQPRHAHVLIVGVEAAWPTEAELRALMQRTQQRAERNDVALLQRHGLGDRAGFFRHFQRLSEVIVRGSQSTTAGAAAVWVNAQAAQALPSKVRTALYRSQGR